MELSEIYQQNNYGGVKDFTPKISFEIFPPKNGNISDLFEELRILKKYNPALVSLTFGASGGLNRFSFEDIKSIRDLELNLMPHFTCVSMIKSEIENYIRSIENLGIENILALRGDIPEYLNTDDLDFIHASDLVDFIHTKSTLSIAVAVYPETHIESTNQKEDLKYLKKKVDYGASAIYTQMFFDNDMLYSFLYRLEAAGIHLPVLAGIMPITAVAQIPKMIKLSDAFIPRKLLAICDRFGSSPEALRQAGIAYATDQIIDLISNGIRGIHIYTMNKPEIAQAILENVNDIIGACNK